MPQGGGHAHRIDAGGHVVRPHDQGAVQYRRRGQGNAAGQSIAATVDAVRVGGALWRAEAGELV